MKPLAILTSLFFAVLCLSAAQLPRHATGAQPPRSICGRWVVKRLLPTTNVQTSPASLKKHVGQRAVYWSSEMKFGRTAIEHPLYSTRKLSSAEFFRDSRIPLTELGIKGESVVVVKIRDSAGKDVVRPGTELFIKTPKEIITTWNGGHFLLVRTGQCRR